MSTKNNAAPPTTTSGRNRWDPLMESERHKFRVQKKPPLSLRQFLRSTITSNPHGKHWKPAGTYHAPSVPEKTPSKEVDDQPKVVSKSKDSHPIWRPPGAVKFKRPGTPEEENKTPKSEEIKTGSGAKADSNHQSKTDRESTTPWYPSGNPYYEPVVHFDAPSLRWSTKQIKQSMPEFKSSTNDSSKNPK